MRGRYWAAGLIGVEGPAACIAWTAKGRAGMGESIVFRRRSAEMRRSPRFNLMYEDLFEEAERREEAADVIESVAREDVFVNLCCSLELTEGGWVE